MDILKADNNKQNMILMTILIRMFLQTHFLLYWVKWKQQKYSSSSFFCECATSTTNSYSTRMTCFLSLVLKASIQYIQKQDLNLDFISSNVCSLIFYICIQTLFHCYLAWRDHIFLEKLKQDITISSYKIFEEWKSEKWIITSSLKWLRYSCYVIAIITLMFRYARE